MASDDRLTDRPLHPPGDTRTSEQPTAATTPPTPFGTDLTMPVTVVVVGLVMLIYFFWPLALVQLFLAAGMAPHPTGTPTPQETQALMRLQLLANALAFPLQIASVVLLLPRLGGIRLEQIGLTPRRLGWNVLWGVLGWLALTPACFAVNYGVIALYGKEAATNVQQHPFVQMAAHGLTPAAWLLLIFTGTISGPVMEELFFRGTLQSWQEGRALRSHLVMGFAIIMAAVLVMGFSVVNEALMKANDIHAIHAALMKGVDALMRYPAPVLFLLALSAVYVVVCLRSQTPAAPAVFAASALFASVHSFAWPSPVALFVLALGLGTLAYRTRSLAGPMVLHGLFNAVSCVLLFFPQSGVSP